MRLVCEAKDLEHALQLKRLMQKIYPYNTHFETKPFNDKKSCPCSVCKGPSTIKS